MAPHSSTLAWKNPMDEGAWKAAVHGVAEGRTRLSDFIFTFHFHALEKEMATHSSVLAWRIPGMGSLVGCRLWGRTESDTTEVIQQQQVPGSVLASKDAVDEAVNHMCLQASNQKIFLKQITGTQ